MLSGALMGGNGNGNCVENCDNDRHGFAPYELAKNDFDEVTNGWVWIWFVRKWAVDNVLHEYFLVLFQCA